MSSNDWRPSASMAALKERATLFRGIRSYFESQMVMEVETPILSTSATVDVHIDSFHCDFHPVGRSNPQTCYLHTSPEFAMKRLLAAGSGDIYSMGHVFRRGEIGDCHNPEFTMLEWYRIGMDQQRLMDDVAAMLKSVSFFNEVKRCSYGDLFDEYLGINPHTVSDCKLSYLVRQKVDSQLVGIDRNDCLDLLFSSIIEPTLGAGDASILSGVFVYDYPACMSALAKIKEDRNGDIVSARFELFVNGVELANGYHELQDAEEQLHRFKCEQRNRGNRGLPVYHHDHRLISALAYGMPDCAGVALGVDRLLMLIMNRSDIADVITFSFTRT
ncbi:MAG: EF-P lysine aminoacylase EpmA [Candidatus Endonucleobacter bathymodioli]|uniref:EF-P lysine aminoacylase EpmA n=1 Tax=Candidatus Endonucleibacter bathymodioli TaxID=539814 RepID=A0AA90NLT9_9GAMM|nr:EF-P lysine aminoacylase EpmA [Candidatus Endonucleobacter bathymodioli]